MGKRGMSDGAGNCAVLHQTTPWGATGTCRYSGNTHPPSDTDSRAVFKWHLN